MKFRTLVILSIVIVLGGALAGWIIARYQAGPRTVPSIASEERKAAPAPAATQPLVVITPEPVPVEETVSTGNTPRQTAPPARVSPSTATYPEYRPLDPAAKELLGRASLSFVGADPLADEVWASLIYDTSLSDSVREDLMEDLNENGFSGGDGDVPTVDDLPLIETRIILLEEHMVVADDFMLEHLGEAHKDLVNMWVGLIRR